MKPQIIPIERLGKERYDSPLIKKPCVKFISDDEGITYQTNLTDIAKKTQTGELLFFELAGPRKKIYFRPNQMTCGIVTCGGLCPGLNDVIRAIVYALWFDYGVTNVLGFRYGYKGLTKKFPFKPIRLDPDMVDEIHSTGGTILSSSRGKQDVAEMVETLKKQRIKILFTVGGDGTMRGAQEIAQHIKRKKLGIAVIAVPKTIDNDINYIRLSFGFQTAVEASMPVIESAHIEAKGAPNGIGLVKLMGRHSGFIACDATLSNSNVNFCLIPEIGFRLEGPGGLFEVLRKRLIAKQHAVIVVAEGAGQDLIEGKTTKDASGNVRLKDVGPYLKGRIQAYFEGLGMEVNLKYFDPSYSLRSVPANALDSRFCLVLGHCAVHAGMSGRTGMLAGFWNDRFIHVPIPMAVHHPKRVDAHGDLWHMVMRATQQPNSIFQQQGGDR